MPQGRPHVVLVTRCFVQRGDGKLLLIQRTFDEQYSPGKWEVPGGKVEKGQDLANAKAREIREETGLVIEPMQSLVFAADRLIPSGKYAGMHHVVLFSIGKLVGGRINLSDEHIDYFWERYDRLFSQDLTHQTREAAIALRAYLA